MDLVHNGHIENLPFDHDHVGIHEIPGCVAPASWLHRHLWKVLPEERGGLERPPAQGPRGGDRGFPSSTINSVSQAGPSFDFRASGSSLSSLAPLQAARIFC